MIEPGGATVNEVVSAAAPDHERLAEDPVERLHVVGLDLSLAL